MRTRSELTRLTWPMPWPAVVLPAAALAAVFAVWVWRVNSWEYISPSAVSLLPLEAQTLAGLVAAVWGGYIGTTFLRTTNPFSGKCSARAAAALPLRVTVTIALWSVGAIIVGTVPLSIYFVSQATGGHYLIGTAVVAVPMLVSEVVVGVGVGAVISRWFAPLIALVVDLVIFVSGPILLWVLVPPGPVGSTMFPTPGMYATPYDPYSLSTWAIIVGVWTLAAIACTGLAIGVRRWQYRGRPAAALLAACVLLATVTGAGFAQSSGLLHKESYPVALECRTIDSGPRVCVTREQSRILGRVSSTIGAVKERLGTWPDQYSFVATAAAYDVLLQQGTATEDRLILLYDDPDWDRTGPAGDASQVGQALSGATACVNPDTKVLSDNQWSNALWNWITEAPGPLLEDKKLANASVADVRQWYRTNMGTLLSCTYEGSGP